MVSDAEHMRAVAREPVVPPPTRTDRNSYTLRGDERQASTTIHYRFRNPLLDTVFIQHCGLFLFTIEQQVEGRWRHFWTPPSFSCASEPVVVPPGSELHDSVDVHGYWPDPGRDIFPTFAGRDLSGRFRLVWDGLVTLPAGVAREPHRMEVYARGVPLPLDYRYSNEFRLVVNEE